MHRIQPNPEKCRLQHNFNKDCPFIYKLRIIETLMNDRPIKHYEWGCKIFEGDIATARKMCKEKCKDNSKVLVIEWKSG